MSSTIADRDNSSDEGDGEPRSLSEQLQLSRSSRYFAIDETYSSDAFFGQRPIPRSSSPTLKATPDPSQHLPLQILTLNDVVLDPQSTYQTEPKAVSSTLNYPEDSPRSGRRG